MPRDTAPEADPVTAGAPGRRLIAVSPALALAGLLLVAGNLRAGITTVGPVLGDITRDLGLTSVSASVLISVPLLAFAVVSPVTPAIARAVGLERTLAAGLGLLAVGLVVRSLPGTGALWTGTALLGIAIAVLNVALPSVVKRDFPTRIGQVTGTYSAVQSVFAALAAGVAVPLAGVSALGWRLPLGVWALLAVVGLAVIAPQLRARGADADRPLTPARAAGTGRSVWRSSLAWQVTAFMGLQSVMFYALITWLPSIESAAGVPAEAAGVDLLLLNACGIVGSVTCSAVLPRTRDQRLLATGVPALFGVAFAGLLVAPSLASLWASIAGLSGGGCIVLALSFFGLRTAHHRTAAALSGMAQCVGYLLAAAAPMAIGLLHDLTGSWTTPLVALLAVTPVLMAFGLLAGRHRLVG